MAGDEVNIQFDANEYARPNQKWRCGRADEGLPCPSGPNRDGSCGAICRPYKKDDRYYCDNASILGGNCDFGPQADGACCFSPAQCVPIRRGREYICGRGVCPDGPTPDGACCKQFRVCRPVRTVMARRRLVSLCAFAAALAAVCLMLGGSRSVRNRMISPGELVANHMAVASDCNKCHAIGEGGIGDLVNRSWAGESALAQNALCEKCHRDLGPATKSPHSCKRSTLDAITARIEPNGNRPILLGASRAMFGATDELACAACHHEHHGAGHDLKRMTDSQCQSCHSSSFDSFEAGHPEFTAYPYLRRTRIYFDHQSHYGVHFRDAARLPARDDRVRPFLIEGDKVQQSCLACHVPDLAGKKIVVHPFEQSCAACHAQQIEDPFPGLTVFAVPVLDPDVFPGMKPVRGAATSEAVGMLPPITRLLLNSNNVLAELDAYVSKLDLSDLPGQDDRAARYVDALREEMKEIRHGGQQGIEDRLFNVLGSRATRMEVQQMAGLVRHDWINLALDRFRTMFAMANDDGGAAGEDATSLFGAPGESDETPERFDRGWYTRREALSLRYRPAGHADPLLRVWLDVSARFGGDPSAPAAVRDVYRALSHPASVGRCMKCHTVDRRPGGGFAINWQPYRPVRAERTFTKFSHQPHLIMFSQQACTECHKLKGPSGGGGGGEEDTLYRSEFISADFQPLPTPLDVHSNFQPVMKADCTACHQADRVSHGCTTCHNYHVTTEVITQAAPGGPR